jgi:TusA-related sulfurtransferase
VSVAEGGLRIDCTGQRCPLPVIMVARRISEVPVGGTVTVLADDPAARLDLPAWCRMRGQEFAGETDAGGVPVYTIRRVV